MAKTPAKTSPKPDASDAPQGEAAAAPTHRCNWLVRLDGQRYPAGREIALSDELAEQLGDAVSPL